MPRITRTACVALLLLAMTLGGCGNDIEPKWVDDDTSYTRVGARELLEQVDSAAFSDTPDTEAKDKRHDTLVSLRGRGGDAADAATLVTKTFPTDTSAVPVYFERARVDGRDALIMIEAWGPSGGSLSLERMWIIDASTGDILDSVAEH